ncbi:MAG: diphthine synthase [Candidatus Bathyarchaeia archaeon]
MPELKFIGLGLYDELGMSLRGLEEARAAGVVFLELYTSPMPGLSIKRLERLLGKPIRPLGRGDLEERFHEAVLEPVKEAGSGALLVPGDPMVFTTHAGLRLEAERAGIRTSIIHAPSILSAVCGATGLHGYKFGKAATIPIPEGPSPPESPYECVRDNRARGLHTLLLMDFRADEGAAMTINEALGQLLAIESKRGERALTPDTLVVGVARIGSPNQLVRGGRAKRMLGEEFGPPPHCLVIPGVLHFVERDYLRTFAGVKEEDFP